MNKFDTLIKLIFDTVHGSTIDNIIHAICDNNTTIIKLDLFAQINSNTVITIWYIYNNK